MPIRSLFIANRGEIAVRIIRAARELGIETVQAYSDADEHSLAVQMADRSVNVGPPHATKSYLNVEGIVSAAKATWNSTSVSRETRSPRGPAAFTRLTSESAENRVQAVSSALT